jgi:hypothetical protein
VVKLFKRILSSFLILTLSITLISGCVSKKQDKPKDNQTNEISNAPSNDSKAKTNPEANPETKTSLEVKTDSGRFLGQIDSNSVEIRKSGVPESSPPEAFQLSEELKEKINDYNLNQDDEIRFKYTLPNEQKSERPVIIEIEKL